ncbi:transcription elongation factor GreA [Stomatohabitans albus]|uniref:transcription elongation factor GreA n=1 Tax=Stomatohabitans albus TaxID=3110766 RepID=UPI00300CA333
MEQMTQETFDRLTAELEELTTTVRDEITERIEIARDHGDLKENAEYHAAKDEQGMNEDRIRVIQARLDNAEIVEDSADTSLARVGMAVTIKEDGETYDIFLGSLEDAADTDLEIVSVTSPMGRAINGSKEGAKVTWAGPTGTKFEAEVMSFRQV